MDIKLHLGGTVDAKEVMTYRVSTVKDTGKAIAWHEHGSEETEQPAVYQNFGISYNEGQAARKTEEWAEVAEEYAKEYADANEGADVSKYLKKSEDRPGRNGGIKKADYEEIGREVVSELVEAAAQNEDAEVEYHTTLEWVKEQLQGVKESNTFLPVARPEKPKPVPSATKAILDAREKAAAEGLSEEVLDKIFGKKD